MRATDRFARHMGRVLRVRAALVTTLAAGLGPPAMAEPLLESHRWQHRILLIFAPAGDDARVVESLEVPSRHRCGFENRDLITGVLLPDDGRLGDRPVGPAENRRLRAAFRIGPDDFAVILVGKDGGEKLRLDRPPTASELFELIDSMPMRRAEMAADRDCTAESEEAP